jgi:hypothetical protein
MHIMSKSVNANDVRDALVVAYKGIINNNYKILKFGVEVFWVAWVHCECGGAVHRTMETEYFVVATQAYFTRGVSIFRV